MVVFPEKDELVIANVKKILPYGAFCYLPEYKIDAFLHVSQVSSGWVKNIHEFLSEGKQIVVKVHHIDTEKNQIDISLRRVTEDEKRKKKDSLRREKKGEKLLEIAIKNSKIKEDVLKIKTELLISYEDLFGCFEDAFEDPKSLDSLKIPKKLKDEIISIANISIKKSSVTLDVLLKLICYDSNGVEKIKEILELKNDKVKITYLGAPKYKLTLIADEYKAGEKELSKLLSEFEKKAEKYNCTFEFSRENE